MNIEWPIVWLVAAGIIGCASILVIGGVEILKVLAQ